MSLLAMKYRFEYTEGYLFMLVVKFKKAERYYHVYEQPTLFTNEVDLVCVWGTFDSNRHGQKLIICRNSNDLSTQLNKIKKRRKTRCYEEYDQR